MRSGSSGTYLGMYLNLSVNCTTLMDGQVGGLLFFFNILYIYIQFTYGLLCTRYGLWIFLRTLPTRYRRHTNNNYKHSDPTYLGTLKPSNYLLVEPYEKL